MQRIGTKGKGPHPSMAYATPYETAKTLFGLEVEPEFLIQRVRSFPWEDSFYRLAQLAAKVTRFGPDSELIRRLTIDPLAALTGDASAASLIQNARRAVAERRNRMVVAHEQAISFMQHLVLLEGGGEGPEKPADAELSLWLACAGTFLSRWREESEASAERHALIASMSHGLRFNNSFDAARTLVRSSLLFATPPANGDLAVQATWDAIVADAFGGRYEEFLEAVLGPLYMLSQGWGDESSSWPNPAIDTDKFLAETKVPADRFVEMLKLMSADRETLRETIRKRTKDGLPHAPTALLYQPFVQVTNSIYVAASPWAIQHQVRFAPWAQMMYATKRTSAKGGPDPWFRAFGQLVEAWCRRTAVEAERSPYFRARLHMPATPGGDDEVEDVVLIEGRAVVLFSVKSRVMDAKAAREATSVATTMDWYRDYFFEKRGDDYRGGAVRQLDKRVQMIREGKFEDQGIASTARILPVIVTYDSLGESDPLYRWLEARCAEEGLLQGPDVGPVTLARVDEFEDLMARAADGKSVVEILRRREQSDRYRRLDQVLHEHLLPKRRRRLPFFNDTYHQLVQRILGRLFKGDPEGSTLP